MSSKSFILLATAVSLLPFVSAHGRVSWVSANGQTNQGLNPYYVPPGAKSAIRLMYTNSEPLAFVDPSGWSDNSKMACEYSGNKPAAQHLTVSAGSSVTIGWEGATGELTTWDGQKHSSNPYVHATGPILDYLTDCKGDCTKFDATSAGWTKIAAMGIDMNQSIDERLRSAMAAKPEPYYPKGKGLWASAKLVQQGSTWNVNIPKELKTGKYILRHEMANMHSPKKNQHYIACIQLDVINGGGASLPGGTQAKDLYQQGSQFHTFDIYSGDHSTFKVPGPALWDRSGGSEPAPAPEPTPSKPVDTPKPTPSKPVDAPKPPTPSVSPPSNPGTPSQPDVPQPSTTKKCRARKRAIPSPVAVSKRHRKRLSAEH